MPIIVFNLLVEGNIARAVRVRGSARWSRPD